METQAVGSTKIKTELTYDPDILFLNVYPKDSTFKKDSTFYRELQLCSLLLLLLYLQQQRNVHQQ